MRSKWFRRLGLAAIAGAMSYGSVGCASEKEAIVRVDNNTLPKSFFVGQKYNDPSDDPEFHARSMIIDVPYGASGADWGLFTNSINIVTRIRWELTETDLIGRLSYERINGTDGQGTAKAAPKDGELNGKQDGQVVFMFGVQHLDIRRQYNAQTGEEANVIEENRGDRRWWDRDYIRVDWRHNKNTTSYSFDTLSLLGVYGSINWSAAMGYNEQNQNTEDKPVFALDEGYIDVTDRLFAQPEMLDLGWGRMPACMLPNIIRGGTEPTKVCNATEVKVRHSFKRVVDKDYEPMDWDGFRFETYGAFLAERQGYSREYGLVDKQWYRFIDRYNVWERSHYYDKPETMEGPKACNADSECKDIGSIKGASRCDKFNTVTSSDGVVRGKCTLPFTDRKIRPIVWHHSDNSNNFYFDDTLDATYEWDTAMRAAITSARYGECKRWGGANCGGVMDGQFAQEEDTMFLVREVNTCRRLVAEKKSADNCDQVAENIGKTRGLPDTSIALAKMPAVVILCHSPVAEGDDEQCGKKGTIARLGDLRFNLVTSVEKPETDSPWGIMSDAADPLTGEKLASSINIWTHVNDMFAQGLIDATRYIKGELKTEDITDGKYVYDWAGAANKVAKGSLGSMTMSKADVGHRLAATVGMDKMPENVRANPQATKAMMNAMQRVSKTRAAADAASANAPIYDARRKMAQGTPLEAALQTPAMVQLAASGVGDNTSAREAASAFRDGFNPTARREMERAREMAFAKRGMCMMQQQTTAPLGYTALADALEAKFGNFNPSDSPEVQKARALKMKEYIARRAHYSVIAHEMGHSFALRHNFVSSSDAHNYRPQYWQLRTNNKATTKVCKEASKDGTDCIGPRWFDPVSDNEARNHLHLWMASSTMEYAGEPTQDLLGLGQYDFGAARMFYGDTVAVYADAGAYGKDTEAGKIALYHQNTFGGLLGIKHGSSFSKQFHYSELDKRFNLIQDCEEVDINSFKPKYWDEAKYGKWHPVIDGRIVTNEQGVFTKCKQPKVDYVPWTAMEQGEAVAATDSEGRVRVPHGFATDDWADLGNVSVYRHDNGADVYELMHFWIAQQEISHIFSNYRRGKRDFSIWGAFNRTQGRYHEKMRDAAKAIGLYVNLGKDTQTNYDGGDPAAFTVQILQQVATDNTLAAAIAFDHFAHVYARPQPGEHSAFGDDPVLRSCDGTAFAQCAGLNPLIVTNGVTGGYGKISLGGRPIQNELARDKGSSYDRDYTLNVGSYYEKAFAAGLLTESADNFISSSRDDFVDPRFRSVSIADVFPDGFRRWIANNLTGDDFIKGPRAIAGSGSGGEGKLATMGWTSWWPAAGIESCFLNGEQLSCRQDPFSDQAGAPAPAQAQVVDPEIGWEQQKFALLMTMLYLPTNQKLNWVNMMRVERLGTDGDPGFDNRIEFHDPFGSTYIAQTFGTETLFGKTVQKGIGARVLEYANELVNAAFETTAVTKNGTTWYIAKLDAKGLPILKGGAANCDASAKCLKLRNYSSMPQLLRQGLGWFGHIPEWGNLKGVY